ncbi:MAG: glycoside hydrolase family 99-like domain-containing protein [Armatimonadota bacterium]
MRKLLFVLIGLFMLSSCLYAGSAPVRTVVGWTFDTSGDLRGWELNGHLSNVQVGADGLSAEATDWDPFMTSPTFDIPAEPQQWIEIRIKCDKAGEGQIYWSNTMDSPYQGFVPEKYTNFSIKDNNGWTTLVIRPFWQTEKKIIHMRIDMFQGAKFTIKSIKIQEPAVKPDTGSKGIWNFSSKNVNWIAADDTPFTRTPGGISMTIGKDGGTLQSPMLSMPIKDKTWAAVRMKSTKGGKAFLQWATDSISGLQATPFQARGDGRFHTYNIDLGSNLGWSGKLLMLGLKPSSTPGDHVEIASISMEKDMVGGPDLDIDYFGMEDAVNRAGKPCRLMARFVNQGGAAASGITAKVTAPKGVMVRQISAPSVLDPLLPESFRYELVSKIPVQGEVTIHLTGNGAPVSVYKASINITANPVFEKNGYVPAIKPAKTDYNIGMFYFPGWDTAGKWEPINRVAPIRKPVLGWYDESNPECADWQIKWAAEHGISFFVVDWYWTQGNRMLEHWLNNAYGKSKYKKNLKWTLMWANHNPPGTHTLDDWKNVTKFWIDNYFGTDEYLKIDGKPVVYMWSPGGIRNDVGTDGAAGFLAASQEMARKAGYPGITFIGMNEALSPLAAKTLATEGYSGYTDYHWWTDSMSIAKDPKYFPFSLVVDRSRKAWEERGKILKDAGLYLQPPVETGWDPRPWHGDRSFVVHGRTVGQFERLLRDAKSYLDARNEKTFIVGPCNEWGEGSYIEPCAEFGFGMYDAIRKVFCEDEPHVDIAPVDVGMGPYDMPFAPSGKRTEWKFDKAGDTEGWYSMMNLTNAESADGSLKTSTIGTDPAISSPAIHVRASQFSYVIIRMKLTKAVGNDDQLQLFWSTPTMGTSEATSVRTNVIADGQFHTYVLPVSENPRWQGFIRGFRIDPCSSTGSDIQIDEIRLSKTKP